MTDYTEEVDDDYCSTRIVVDEDEPEIGTFKLTLYRRLCILSTSR